MSAVEGEPQLDPAVWFAGRSWRERRALRRAALRGREPRDRQTAATLAWLVRREAWRSLWTAPLTMVGIALVLVLWRDVEREFLVYFAFGWASMNPVTQGLLRRSRRRFTDEPGGMPPWSLVVVSCVATAVLPLLVVGLVAPPGTGSP